MWRTRRPNLQQTSLCSETVIVPNFARTCSVWGLSLKTSPFSVERGSVADRVLVSSSRGHWHSNTQNQEIKMIASSPDVFGEVVLLRLVRLRSDSEGHRQRKQQWSQREERKKSFAFHSTTVCFQSLRRRSASEASVMTSLRRARGSEEEEGKKWNVLVWTNQRVSETVAGGT